MDKIFADERIRINNLQIPEEYLDKYGKMEKWDYEFRKEYMRLKWYVNQDNASPLQIKKFNYLKSKKCKSFTPHFKGKKQKGLIINHGIYKFEFK